MISRTLMQRIKMNYPIMWGYYHLCCKWPAQLLGDKNCIKIKYFLKMGKRLNLNKPRTFNEKIQWLKLYNRCPNYTGLVDKYEVRKYISETIGEKYLIPLVGGPWESIDEANIDDLPKQFVLKCTHDSGHVLICREKASFDYKSAKKKFRIYMNRNFYFQTQEWPYKNVIPKIIAEQYMIDSSGYELKDYKLMCFNGKVKCSFTCSNRGGKEGLYVNFYDTEWNPMPFSRHYKRNPIEIEKPVSYNEMVYLAERLANGIPFVRVDFYEINGKPYFGEMTFFPGNGMEEFTPEEWDYLLGRWIELQLS